MSEHSPTMPDPDTQAVVFGRSACVGQDVFQLKTAGKYRLINLQKARLDLLMNWIEGAPRPKASIVDSYMPRRIVFPMIEQQERLEWFSSQRKPQFIMMDAYSEMTDQEFTHREEGWSFCCHYTDLDPSVDFERRFEKRGLLPLEELENTYRRFFNWVEREFPLIKVIFVHYSTRFDSRELFQGRANEILRVMKKLQSLKPYIHNLWLDDHLYHQQEGDSFPYHYSKDTYQSLVDIWNKAEGEQEHRETVLA